MYIKAVLKDPVRNLNKDTQEGAFEVPLNDALEVKLYLHCTCCYTH